MARDLDDKKLAFVSRMASEFDNLLTTIQRINALQAEWSDLNYDSNDPAIGISDAVLTDTDYGYVTAQQLQQAFNNWTTWHTALTQTIRRAFLRLRP